MHRPELSAESTETAFQRLWKKTLALQHTSKREKCIGENMENI